jgi:hypothetical protein
MKTECEINMGVFESLGFENLHFGGYGGTGFKKGDLSIWFDEWGHTTLSKSKDRVLLREIYLPNISDLSMKQKLIEALKEINDEN